MEIFAILQNDKMQSGTTNVQVDRHTYYQQPYLNGRLELPAGKYASRIREELLRIKCWKDVTPAPEYSSKQQPDREPGPQYKPVIMKHPDSGKRGVIFSGSFGCNGTTLEFNENGNGTVICKSLSIQKELEKIGFFIVDYCDKDATREPVEVNCRETTRIHEPDVTNEAE